MDRLRTGVGEKFMKYSNRKKLLKEVYILTFLIKWINFHSFFFLRWKWEFHQTKERLLFMKYICFSSISLKSTKLEGFDFHYRSAIL